MLWKLLDFVLTRFIVLTLLILFIHFSHTNISLYMEKKTVQVKDMSMDK